MQTTQIVTQLDNNALVAIRIMTTIFVALIVALSFLFSIALTAFVICWFVARKMIVIVMSSKQAAAAFAMVGGAIS